MNYPLMEIILSILSLAVAAGGYALKRLNDSLKSYSQSYGAEVAKIDANTERLQEIQDQLAQSVKLTESIKNDIEHGAWRKRELELLKREKLEKYLICHYEATENFTRKMKRSFFYDETLFDESCEAKLSMLQNLYLPELDAEHSVFLQVSANFSQWIASGLAELLEKRRAGEPKPFISNKHMKEYTDLLNQATKATLLIEAKAREIGRQLNVA